MPQAGPLPPPPAPTPSLPAVPDARSALMDAIKEGHKLKSVSATNPSDGSDLSVKKDSRTDLLGQIRAGKELKPVEKKVNPATVTDDVMEGMAGALARALEERCRVIHSDSDESGQDPDEDDHWDD